MPTTGTRVRCWICTYSSENFSELMQSPPVVLAFPSIFVALPLLPFDYDRPKSLLVCSVSLQSTETMPHRHRRKCYRGPQKITAKKLSMLE